MPKTKESTQLEVLGLLLSLCVPIMMTETNYGGRRNHIKTSKYCSCIYVFNSNQEMPSPTRCTVKYFLHKV